LDEKILFYLSIYLFVHSFLFSFIDLFLFIHFPPLLIYIFVNPILGFCLAHMFYFSSTFSPIYRFSQLFVSFSQLLEFFIHLWPFVSLCLSISISFTYFWGFHPFCPLFIHSFIYAFFFLSHIFLVFIYVPFFHLLIYLFFHCI